MTLCSSCRRTLLSRLQQTSRTLRYASTTSAPTPTSNPNPPPPELLQPFSTPTTTPTSKPPPPTATPSKKPPTLISSIPGGTELRGLGYLKAKPTILAKEDDEYPAWLWTLLSDPSKAGDGGAGGDKVDLASLTKRQRIRHDRKLEKLRASLPPSIPLHEQSKDLTSPSDSAIVSLERRQEITKSARVARRKGIREANFLKGM